MVPANYGTCSFIDSTKQKTKRNWGLIFLKSNIFEFDVNLNLNLNEIDWISNWFNEFRNDFEVTILMGGKKTFLDFLAHLTLLLMFVVVGENTETIDNPMHEAAKRGNTGFLKELLDAGMSVNTLDTAGNTPLHWAARSVFLLCLHTLNTMGAVLMMCGSFLFDCDAILVSRGGHEDCLVMILAKKPVLEVQVWNPRLFFLWISCGNQELFFELLRDLEESSRQEKKNFNSISSWNVEQTWRHPASLCFLGRQARSSEDFGCGRYVFLLSTLDIFFFFFLLFFFFLSCPTEDDWFDLS